MYNSIYDGRETKRRVLVFPESGSARLIKKKITLTQSLNSLRQFHFRSNIHWTSPISLDILTTFKCHIRHLIFMAIETSNYPRKRNRETQLSLPLNISLNDRESFTFHTMGIFKSWYFNSFLTFFFFY